MLTETKMSLADSPDLNLRYDFQVFFDGNLKRLEIGPNDHNRQIVVGGNYQRPSKIKPGVYSVTSFLPLEFTADEKEKFLEIFVMNRPKTGHQCLRRNGNLFSGLSHNGGRNPFFLNFYPSAFLKHFFKSSHFHNLVNENLKRFFECFIRIFVRASLGGQIKGGTMSHKGVSFFYKENLDAKVKFFRQTFFHVLSPLKYSTAAQRKRKAFYTVCAVL